MVGALLENWHTPRNPEQHAREEETKNGQRCYRSEEPNDGDPPAGRWSPFGDACLSIGQRAEGHSDRRSGHETRKRHHPKPERHPWSASACHDLLGPDLWRLTKSRKCLTRLLASVPDLCGKASRS